MNHPRIGIDNYGLLPLALSPLDTLEWAHDHGAQGVHFSGLGPEEHATIDTHYLKDMARFAESRRMYLEWGGGQHLPYDTETWEERDIFEVNRTAASEARMLGTRIIRSCSGGLFRWRSGSPSTERLLEEMAKALRAQRSMLKDHGVILAIETHFEFTTHELVRLFEKCDAMPGDYLGICLDTMNLLTMLEDPVMGTERILPWVVATHIKDGALTTTDEGLLSFPTGIGAGIVDLEKISGLLSTLPWEVNLSIEGHGGSFSLPVFDAGFLSKFPDLTVRELASLVERALQYRNYPEGDRCGITTRETWPGICESRIRQDIISLKEILS